MAQTLAGIYYFLDLPSASFDDGSLQLNSGGAAASTPLNAPNAQGRYLAASGTGIRLSGKRHQQVK